ncbi:MAG: YggT family protein [Bacteriovoracia bacterium]
MLHVLIDIFVILVVIDAIVSFVPNPQVKRHPMVIQLRKIVDVPQKPIRQLLPPNIPFDPSPIIVILLLRMIGAIL